MAKVPKCQLFFSRLGRSFRLHGEEFISLEPLGRRHARRGNDFAFVIGKFDNHAWRGRAQDLYRDFVADVYAGLCLAAAAEDAELWLLDLAADAFLRFGEYYLAQHAENVMAYPRHYARFRDSLREELLARQAAP